MGLLNILIMLRQCYSTSMIEKLHQNMRKTSSLLGKEFGTEPVYYGDNGKYVTTWWYCEYKFSW